MKYFPALDIISIGPCGVTAMNTLLVYLSSIKIVDCSPSVYGDPKSGEEPNKSKDMLLIPDSDCWNECSAGCRHKIFKRHVILNFNIESLEKLRVLLRIAG